MEDNQNQSLITHLLELRTRVLKGLVGFVACLIVLLPFSTELYQYFVSPLLEQFVSSGIASTGMIAISVASPMMTPIKLAAFAALVISMPWIIVQLWLFISPGLYDNEKLISALLLVTSILMFYGGIAFSFYVILPLLFQIFIIMTPEGITMNTDISYYFDFVISNFVVMGLAFQTPVVLWCLLLLQVVSLKQAKKARPYIILAAFMVGMLLTPPDIFSQLLFALPLWLLYEFGLILSIPLQSIISKNQAHKQEERKNN